MILKIIDTKKLLCIGNKTALFLLVILSWILQVIKEPAVDDKFIFVFITISFFFLSYLLSTPPSTLKTTLSEIPENPAALTFCSMSRSLTLWS